MAEAEREVCGLVHRFAQRLDGHVRRVAEELGRTPAQIVALRELDAPITARELAARMTCEPSTATFVIDRLEEQGLAERRPHPTDRRAKQIVLTAAGARCRAAALDRLAARSPLAALDEREQTRLRGLLARLVDAGAGDGGAGSRR